MYVQSFSKNKQKPKSHFFPLRSWKVTHTGQNQTRVFFLFVFVFNFFLFFSFLFVFYIIKGKKKPVTVKLHKHCYRLTWSYGTSKPWSLLPSVKGPQEKAAPKSADAGSHLLAPERKVCALWYSRAERTCLRAMTESEQPWLSCRQVGTSWCVSF